MELPFVNVTRYERIWFVEPDFLRARNPNEIVQTAKNLIEWHMRWAKQLGWRQRNVEWNWHKWKLLLHFGSAKSDERDLFECFAVFNMMELSGSCRLKLFATATFNSFAIALKCENSLNINCIINDVVETTPPPLPCIVNTRATVALRWLS